MLGGATRMTQWPWPRVALIAVPWILSSAFGEAADARVGVEKQPVVVVHRTYDPEHPTDNMPDLKPPEIGLCISEFGCEIKMSTSTPDGRLADTKIESIHLATRLKITIWTRVLAAEREVTHEEAHRTISEAYYREADQVARRLAEEVVGRRLFRVLRKRDRAMARHADSVEAACDALQGQLLEEYLAQTHWRCAFAQECFDAITDHGRNEIGNEEAVARAIAEEAAQAQAKR
jgi:hypothetical protein